MGNYMYLPEDNVRCTCIPEGTCEGVGTLGTLGRDSDGRVSMPVFPSGREGGLRADTAEGEKFSVLMSDSNSALGSVAGACEEDGGRDCGVEDVGERIFIGMLFLSESTLEAGVGGRWKGSGPPPAAVEVCGG